MPESAARIEPAPAYVAGGARGAMTMIIDYHALAKAPMPASHADRKSSRQSLQLRPMAASAPAKLRRPLHSAGPGSRGRGRVLGPETQ